jgi:hypothetical protein
MAKKKSAAVHHPLILWTLLPANCSLFPKMKLKSKGQRYDVLEIQQNLQLVLEEHFKKSACILPKTAESPNSRLKESSTVTWSFK